MVPLETLDATSDYSPFLSEGVSSELKKAALKKLFFSGKFAARDGLDDYDDDFTYFEPLGDTVTSDMKYHARRKERERLAKLEEEAVHESDLQDEGAQPPVAEVSEDMQNDSAVKESEEDNLGTESESADHPQSSQPDHSGERESLPENESDKKDPDRQLAVNPATDQPPSASGTKS